MTKSNYDYFAWFYDKYWGESFARRILPTVQRLALSKVRAGARILDLCCGTGHLSKLLQEEGYRVVGVDNSKDMLAFAKLHAPAATLILDDAQSFSLDVTCDAAISTYDSLNHIMSLTELEQVFANVARALTSGAPFLFDLNTTTAFTEFWRGRQPFSFLGEDHACICQSSYDDQTEIAQLDVAMFRLIEGLWERRDVRHIQRAYTVDEVSSVLAHSGFEEPELYDMKGEQAHESTPRIVYVTRRK